MRESRKSVLLIAIGIIFISFVLRGTITGVGSLVGEIKTDLNISNGIAGFLTTIPLLAFAAVSPFVSGFGKKIGMGRLMMVGLILVIIGVGVRSYTNAAGVFIGTAVIGGGIAIGNVLAPAMIKLKFPLKIGLMTSLYTTFMATFAGIAMGFSVPLSRDLGIGWKNALAIWGLVALAALVVWLPQCGKQDNWGKETATQKVKSGRKVYTSSLAWAVTFFMGLQSILFYSFVAWLPTILASKGYAADTAGYYALAYQIISIPASFITPILCDRFKDQRVLVTVFAVIYLLGMILFLFAESGVLLGLSIVMTGIGSGSAISFAMAFIALRASNPIQAAELSGMAQSLGYLLAAMAPSGFGYIFDLTQTWAVPIIIMAVITFIWLLFGLKAGSNRKIFE